MNNQQKAEWIERYLIPHPSPLERATKHLYDFTVQAWDEVESQPFVDNWHVGAICFPYQTLIETEDGLLPIGRIVEGGYSGKVASFNHAIGEVEWKPILKRMRSLGKPLLRIRVGGLDLELTDDHPVFVVGKGYVLASEIRRGDRVLRLQTLRKEIPSQSVGSLCEDVVQDVERVVRIPEAVYNIEVADNNNYFAESVLVHNCEHLEAVTNGQIENLLINIPPGCSKSLLCCVMWFCWEWANKPSTRFFYASYHQDLTTRDSVKCRALLTSKWYRQRWGRKFSFTDDQNLKLYYENTEGGYRLATTPGGRGTGEHPDRIVIDDPHNVKQAESELERKSIIDWWDLTMSSRGLSRGARRVIIMQRLNELDLSGHLLSKFADEWTLICLPMRYEPGRMKTTVLGFNDPRTRDGELLTPLFSEDAVTKLENRLGPYGVAGQLQQRPAPLEGGMFKRAWFEVVEGARVEFDSLIRSWDLAATEGDGDYTTGILLGRKGDDFWVLDLVRGQWGSGRRDDNIDMIASADETLYGKKVTIWFPQDPAQAGKSQAELLARHLTSAGYAAYYEIMSGEKEVRAQPFASRCWAGERSNRKVKLIKGSWNTAFLNELCTFPNASHDDIVDAVSLGFNKLAKGKRKLVGA